MAFRTQPHLTAFTLCLCLLTLGDSARANRLPAADSRLPVSDLQADPAIPTIRAALGHDWATAITSHAQMERYLQALVKSAPDRTLLVRYGTSYEGRGLYYLAVTSAENRRRLEEIRTANVRLADPRLADADEARRLVAELPALVWFAASVHGNELSGTEAALLTAYHLLADTRPETQAMLEKLVVLIDPLQNPDGRERYVNVYRESRGRFPDANALATEHAERWPGGRFNHYLFDMNRDWFLQSQQETVHKVRAYLRWQPQLYVDMHEMGHNSTYFFAPPADPINPFILHSQIEWMWDLGRQQAEWFDRRGFSYTTREMFDAFYPGYGSKWPLLQGGIGILWEQAGTRGLFVDRKDDTRLHYRDTVLHHYVSCLATLEIAARRHQDLLTDFREARCRGIQLGTEGPVKHFFLPVSSQPDRTANLARVLQRNGINVYRVRDDFTITATDVRTGDAAECTVRKGAYQIPVAQPAGRLVRVLLDQRVDMDERYVTRQLQRKADNLPDQIYDVTAWSLPLAFDVPCLSTGSAELPDQPWDGALDNSRLKLPQAQVAYLVAPTDGALQALCQWLRKGIRVHVTNERFVLGERKFPPGTLIVKKHGNRENLREVMQDAARKFDLTVAATDTGFVTEGAHFGGPNVQWVRPPKIVLAWDRPADTSVGHTWHLFDQTLQYPTTRVSCRNLAQLDLNEFNVLILPDGNYTGSAGLDQPFANRLKQWVKDGGTLVLVKGAALWAAREDMALIALKRVAKPSAEPVKEKPGEEPEEQYGDRRNPSSRWPDSVPGAFLKASLFEQHWLTYGCSPSMSVFFNGNVFFEPLSPEEGRNVVQFVAEDQLLTSGFCWPETKKSIAEKIYLAVSSLGDGHIVAFAGDPNYRVMYPSLQRLFANACLFGPGQ